MHSLPKIFFRWGPAILYMTVCPVFYFVFVLLYEPLGARPFLDMGRGLYAMNLALTFCISLVVISGLRVAFHFLRKVPHFTWAHYIIWCMGEVLVASIFASLYLHLMDKDNSTFFSTLLSCVGSAYLIFIFPYSILTLSFDIGAHRERARALENKDAEDSSLVRFLDIYQRPKLIIAPSAVLYIEAQENYVNIYYTEGDKLKTFELRATMTSLEEIAGRYNFIRCQRSFYINPAHVTVLRKETGGLVYAELDVPGLQSIPVSKKYYDALAKIL